MGKYLAIILLFFIVSCKNNRADSYNDLEVISINDSYSKSKKKINLSEVAKRIEYIPLETDSTCLLTRIEAPNKDILFSNGKIFIKDVSGVLYSFSQTGKFLRKIGNIGRGPGEYSKENYFTLINNDNLVAIYSPPIQKTLFYDFNGNFIDNIKTDFWPLGLSSVDNNLLFINTLGRRRYSNYYNISAISLNGTKHKGLFYKKNEKKLEEKVNFGLKMFSGSSYYLGGERHYFENSSYELDTIWKITNELKVIPKFVIDLKNKVPLKDSKMENFSDFNFVTKYNMFEALYETSKYMFFEVMLAEDQKFYNILYDKLSKKSIAVQFDKAFGEGIHFSFYNDIDGGVPFWPQGKVLDDMVFMLIHGYEMKDYLERKGDNYDAIDIEARERLLKLVEDSKISDNPILMVVTLKE